MFSKIKTYVGKVERANERQADNVRRVAHAQPRNYIEKAIFDTVAVVQQAIRDRAKIDNNDAVNVHLLLRNLRHDLWIDYIGKAKAKPYYKFNDIRVGDFHDDFMKGYPVPNIPQNLRRLTPDILVYDKETSMIYIGDVSCTNSQMDADRRKYLKYKPIADFYIQNG